MANTDIILTIGGESYRMPFDGVIDGKDLFTVLFNGLLEGKVSYPDNKDFSLEITTETEEPD